MIVVHLEEYVVIKDNNDPYVSQLTICWEITKSKHHEAENRENQQLTIDSMAVLTVSRRKLWKTKKPTQNKLFQTFLHLTEDG